MKFLECWGGGGGGGGGGGDGILHSQKYDFYLKCMILHYTQDIIYHQAGSLLYMYCGCISISRGPSE